MCLRECVCVGVYVCVRVLGTYAYVCECVGLFA